MIALTLASVIALGDVLAVGSDAPKLSVEKFMKGDGIASFEPGKVYVLEFWATWCGPCIRAMPHLSQLQRDNPELIVVGVAGFERAPDPATMEEKVRAFLDGRGKDIEFRVALDTDGSMAQAWMNAAKRRTIPTSMVVGADGKIAFIGSPDSQLDVAVAKALGKPAPEAAKDVVREKATDGLWKRGEANQAPAKKPRDATGAASGSASGSASGTASGTASGSSSGSSSSSSSSSSSGSTSGASSGPGPASGGAPKPVELLEPGTTEEVTKEPTDEKGESVSESSSSTTSASTVNGVTVTQTVTESVRVEVSNGIKTTTKRRTVTRSDAPKP